MKNILKFGLLTRFVMLFLFIFGIHAFTPTVALADTLALGLKFLCENGAIAKKADGSDAEFIANEYTSDDLTQKFICNGKYVNTWDNSYEPTVGAITNNDLWSFLTYAASNTSQINFTSSSYDGYATIKVTLDNQSATTAGTTEYYYKFNTYNGSCYYFSNSALTTCLAGAADGTKITIPTRTGYTFGGYYTDKNGAGTQYVDPEGKTINNIYKAVDTPTTLYAQWEAVATAPTITLNNAGATTERAKKLYLNISTGILYTDEKLTTQIRSSDLPVKKYTVTYDAQGGTVSPTNKTVQAAFDGYTVTIKDVEYEVINSNGILVRANLNYLSQAINQGKAAKAKWASTPSVTLPTPAARTGYTFNGWFTSATNGTRVGSAGASYTPTASTTLYAQWEPVECINFVLYSANGANNYKEYDVSQWSNDPYTLYDGKNCPDGSDLIDIATFIGYLPNADNSVPPIFYDSAALLECSNEDEYMGLTGKCKVLEGDIWRQKTKCADGFSGPNGNNYALAGEACSETVYTIEYYAPDNSLLETKTYSPSTTETLPTQFDTYTVTKWEENPNFGGECGFGPFDPGAPVSNVISGFDGCGGYSIKLIAQWEAVATAPTITLNNAGATTERAKKLYLNISTGILYTDEKLKTEIRSSDLPVKKYTVMYDAQGGTVSPTNETVQADFDGYTVTLKDVEYEVITSKGKLVRANQNYLSQAINQGKAAKAKWASTPSVTLPTPAARTGYTFNGWFTSATNGTRVGSAGASYTPTASTTLYAQWTANTFEVYYDGGSSTEGFDIAEAPTVITCTYDQDCIVGKDVDYTLDSGYKMKWVSLSDGKAYQTGDNIKNVVTEQGGTYNLDAETEPRKVDIEYNIVKDGVWGETISLGTCELNKPCYIGCSDVTQNCETSDLVPVGYKLTSIEINADSLEDVVIKMFNGVEDIRGHLASAYAGQDYEIFLDIYVEPNQYTVKFDPNGGTGKMEEQKRTYNDGINDGIRLPANTFTRSGYSFRGWGLYAIMDSYSYANNSQANIVIQNTPVANGGEITLYALWDQCQAGTFEKGGKCERCPSNSDSKAGQSYCMCNSGFSVGGTGQPNTSGDACTPLCYKIELTYANGANTEDYASYYMKHGDYSTVYTSPYCEEGTETWIDQDHFGRMPYGDNFVGFVDEDDELCFLPNGSLTGNCEVSSNDTYWTAKYECDDGYQGAGQYVMAGYACLPDCNPLEVCYTPVEGESCATYYMRTGDNTQIYADNICDKETYIEQEHLGYVINGIPLGLFDSETEEQCLTENGYLTGNCSVTPNSSWIAKYECEDGYTGIGSEVWSGDTCLPDCIAIELGYSENGDGGDSSYSYYMKPGEYGYLYDGNCYTTKERLDTVETEYFGYDNHGTFVGFYMHDDNSDEIVQCTDSNGQILGDCENTVENNGTWWARYRCDTGYTANGDVIEAGDYEPCSNCYELGIIPSADYINTDVVYIQNNGSLYIDSVCQNSVQGDALEPKETPENAKFLGYTNMELPDVSYTGELADDFLCTSSDMNYQLGLTGNCTVSDNDQVWTAVYECAEGYRANGKFVDYDTPCSANVYSVGIVYSCGEYAGGEAPERPKRCSSNDDCIMPSADACGVYPGHTFKEWEIKLNSGNTITVPADENVQSYINAGETGGSWSVTAQWTTDTVYTIEYYCSIDDFSGEVEMSKQCYVGQDDCADFVDPGCENDDYTYSDLYFETGTRIKGTVRINDGYSLMEILGLMADKGTNPNGITTIKVRPNWVASVTLNNQGADLGNGTEVFYVIDGKVYANIGDTQTLSQIERPAKTGYNFRGYYDDTNCDGNRVVDTDGKIDTAYFADKKGNMELHACWKPDWREIWYVVNDHLTATMVLYGTEITIGKGFLTAEDTEETEVEIGERPGYTFTGWITEDGVEYKNGAKYTVTQHINEVLQLYATWTKNEYTINYYDGENPINTTTYTVDTVGMTLYEPDAKEGYIFLGWNTQPDCESTYIYSITENNLDNYELYACWQTGKYTLTYELNGGEWAEGSNVTNTVGYTVEELPMELRVPAERKGYTFNGWYNNVDCEGTAISKIEEAENITLYAKWDLKKYAIEYIMNGGTNNPENPETYTIKERVVLKDPTYNGNGKLFHKWSDTKDCSGGAITGWSGSDAVDKTLYACWKDVIISIKYLCDGTNQIGETQKCSAFAEECTLNANICDGTVKGNYYNSYDIVGFDGSFNKDNDLVEVGFINHLLGVNDFWKADKPTLKLTPVWEPDTYGITLNNGEGVSNATSEIYSKYGVDKFYTNAQCNQTLSNNKVSVPNKDNYNFAGYSVDANSCENDWVVISSNGTINTEKLKTYADETYVSDNPVELYACWEPVSFEVYYNLNDTNNSGTYRNTVVAYNTEVQIGTIIRPDDGMSETLKPEFVGHEFMGWSTERNGNPDNTYEQGALYTIKGHTTFYAQWKVMTFTCKSGEYLNVLACEQCPEGHKCPQTQFTYDKKEQGLIACSGATEYQDQAGQTTCKTVSDGYYKKDNTAQTECGNGYYCKNAVRTVCPDNGLTDTATASDVTDCYKNNQSCTINGGFGMSDVCHYDTTKSGYKNCTDCIINGCISGYYKDGDACTICPKGSYCANSDKNACPDKYTTADTGATQQKDCFTTCYDISVEDGIAHADNATVSAPLGCTYSRGESVTGNPCDIKNGKCVETSCKFDYEMKGGKCEKCIRDNARSFKQGNGNCVVESCEFGYYPYGQSCVPATKECTMLSMHAIAAQQTWDTKTNSYTVCQITECADGYHISDNSCVSDEKTCYVANGSGIQTWNHSFNKWNDECVVTQCNAGYTNDPSLTNETSVHCGRCTNAFDMYGDEAASLYIRECEIATCMYQGKKYILENNECRTICDSKSDETGTRYWNGKECVHECNAGYLEW